MAEKSGRVLQVKSMVIIRNILNPFKTEDAQVREIAYSRSKCVRDYLDDAGFDYHDRRVIVTGKRIEDLSVRVEDGDEIIVIPEVKAPVVAVVSAVISAVWAAAVAHPFLTAFFMLSMGYSVYQYMNQPKMPDFNLGSNGLDEGSPTYGWDGVQTIQEVGVPVAVVYGEHRVGGNIINQFLWDDGDKHYLNVLLAVCEGEIESIEDIELNNNSIANFDGMSVIKRFGTNYQNRIYNFEDLHNIYPVNVNLAQNNPYVYTTIDSDVEAFEIHLRLNNGLFQQNSSSGDIQSWMVTYRVEYKEHSESVYADLGETIIAGQSRSSVRRVFRKDGLAPGQYDIRITRTSEDSSLQPLKQGDLTLFQIDEIKTDDLSYPNTALLGLRLLATDQISGAMPNITAVVKGKKVLIPDVRNAGVPVDWEDYYWDGSDYRFLFDDTLLSWDGTTYVAKYSANPVWCLRDLITSNRFGLGEFIVSENLDMASLLEMSQYCEEKVPDGKGGYEKRFRMDVVIDSNNRALDLLIQLCATFNAMPVYSAGGITFKIDKEAVPTQLFGMGNIIKDSFAQSWKTMKEVPNVIEVQFTDKEKNYRQETIAYIDEAAVAYGEPVRKSQIRLFTTRTSYALRAARYALKVARYINRSVMFRAGIDAVACQAGDIISISHDVPQWGFSGRVQAGSTTTLIKLDREMVIEDGKSYKIQIRFADDSIEEKLIVSPTGTYIEVECEAFTYMPQMFDVYAIGETNKIKKDFRVVAVQREGRNEVQVSALEYNEAVYDDSEITIPQNNYSSLSGNVPLVVNLELTESLVKKTDGTIENAIDVWFDRPSYVENYVKSFAKAKIYLSDNGGISWRARGETEGSHFRITGDIVDGMTYKVKVTSVTDLGQESGLMLAPSSEITVVGKSTPPSDVSTFLVNQDKDRLYFGWSEIPDVDVWGYEIRWGVDWDGGQVVTFQQGTHYLTTNFKTGVRQSYWIKAIDTSGNYSENAKEAVITITDIPFKNIIAEFVEHPYWPGTKENLIINGSSLIIEDGYLSGKYTTEIRDFGYVATVRIGINVITTLDTGRRFDDDTITRFNSSDKLRFTGVENFGVAFFEIRTSEDNSVWSDWLPYQAGDYFCRYFQIRMTLSRENISDNVTCSTLGYYGDLPDIDEYNSDTVSAATEGKQVYFTKIFHEEPIVHIEVTGGDGIYAKFADKSETGFTVKLYDGAGAEKTGSFDWHAHGI
ncbi:MAG: phage tail protein [Candidatus Omnitrophota bacterium]